MPPKARARINHTITNLEALPHTQWGSYSFPLHGSECEGLLEMRLTVNGRQYRPLMCFGPQQGEVTILFGAMEQGNRFVPKSACQQAQENRRFISLKGRTVVHDFN